MEEQHYSREQDYWDEKGETPYSVLTEFDTERILRWIDWRGGGTVLELGGGSGVFCCRLTERPDTWCACLDISYGMLRHAPTPKVQADALKIPFADESFSLVIAAALFHHLPGREGQLLEECGRVLARGGQVVGYDPNGSCIQNRVFMGDGPLRLGRFSPDERPIVPQLMRKQALRGPFTEFEYEFFSFRYDTLTFFEAVQRFMISPIAKGPMVRYLDRWFFWSAVKGG